MCSVASSADAMPPPPSSLSHRAHRPRSVLGDGDDDDETIGRPSKKFRLGGSRWDAAPLSASADDESAADVRRRMQVLRDSHAKVQQPFRCPICLDTFGEIVVECAECAHAFCQPCLLESLKRKDKCPLCRCVPTPLRRNRPVERLVSALPETCQFLENGCWAMLTRATAMQHSLTCGFARFTCPHCHDVFLRHAHDETECAARVFPCPLEHLGCSFRARRGEMDTHLKDKVHFALAQRLLADVDPPSSDMRHALRALLSIATSWNHKDVDDSTEGARAAFVDAMSDASSTAAA
ncbi:Aste57867_8762 [Aphanomyces stellatus]|uniref:Aste57867_8762 protein n=1 Tax=Aphanomyces stellatus TaxID=120398 RepID=A0A485KLE5_9STRA|nr:hypothetical protein As57867_008728 [Aphanomyces stellatus]VFT85648.1 Aste57867_8762 [Aphanomyces stellatus]